MGPITSEEDPLETEAMLQRETRQARPPLFLKQNTCMATKEQSLTHRIMYWLYYATGGLYSSHPSLSRLRRIYFIVTCILIVVVMVVCLPGYYLTASQLTFPDITSTLGMASGLFCLLVLLPAVTYAFHKNMETLMHFICQQCLHSYESTLCTQRFTPSSADDVLLWRILENTFMENSHRYRYYSPLTRGFCWTIPLILVMGSLPSVSVVKLIFSNNKTDLMRTQEQHIWPIPYVEHISSLQVYCIIYLAEACLYVLMCIIAVANLMYLAIVTIGMRNSVVEYCIEMREDSKKATHLMEQYFIVEGKLTSDQPVDTLEETIKLRVKQHHDIIRTIQIITPYHALVTSVMIPAVFFNMIFGVYVVLMTDFSIIYKIKLLLFTSFVVIYLFIYCHAGKMFEDMTEMMIFEVYNMPWYHLPPSVRKLINIFQCQVQRPVDAVALKIFVVNTVIFPKIMRLVYSYANILHNLLSG